MDEPVDRREASPHRRSAAPDDAALGRALALVRFLRERCPWDARQDAVSLRPYLLEEAHEVADAIVAGDDEALAAELGDLLLNLAFQVVLAEERGAFRAPRVVERLEDKMRARHPHIYGDLGQAPDWEELKARERGTEGRGARPPAGESGTGDPFHGVPLALEPLSRAYRLQDRAAALGFAWRDPAGALAKLREETAELERLLRERRGGSEGSAPSERGPREAIREEVGDILFAAVSLARACGAHPSNALLAASEKFERRFREALRLAESSGLDLPGASEEELRRLWEETKRS